MALGHRIIVTDTGAPDGMPDAVFLQSLRELARRVVAAAVRMKYRPGGEPVIAGGHRDGLLDERSLVIIIHSPADDRFRVAVDHRRQVNPALPRGNVRVGWAARRGPAQCGPFPRSLPQNPACAFGRTRLPSDLCRASDRVLVDVLMAFTADDERLAPHPGHEHCPRGLVGSRPAEVCEPCRLVDCHRGGALA